MYILTMLASRGPMNIDSLTKGEKAAKIPAAVGIRIT
jgi:hypothetical protein